MIEIRVHEDVFATLGNQTLCAMHTLRKLREAGVPAVGNIALVGVREGVLLVWRDDSGLDGNEYVYQYTPDETPAPVPKEFRFHEDGLLPTANPFSYHVFIEKIGQSIPMDSSLSAHAVRQGTLTMFRDETLNGDEYVYQWHASTPADDEL